MSREIGKFVRELFEDGTLAVIRTPEELLDVMNAHEKAVKAQVTFLVTGEDELNELAPVELLAGKPFAARVTMAQEIADGKHTGKPFVNLYSGAGFTDGLHTSQQRLLDLSLEERVAKVLHCTIDGH